MRDFTRRSVRIITVLALLAVLVACSSAASPSPGHGGQPRDLDGTNWRAISILDAVPITGAEPTIRFADGQAGGTTGCNTYGGAYLLEGDGSFVLAAMVMTEMACSGAHGTQESVVVKILSDADRLEFLADGTIRVSGASGAAVFAEDPR